MESFVQELLGRNIDVWNKGSVCTTEAYILGLTMSHLPRKEMRAWHWTTVNVFSVWNAFQKYF